MKPSFFAVKDELFMWYKTFGGNTRVMIKTFLSVRRHVLNDDLAEIVCGYITPINMGPFEIVASECVELMKMIPDHSYKHIYATLLSKEDEKMAEIIRSLDAGRTITPEFERECKKNIGLYLLYYGIVENDLKKIRRAFHFNPKPSKSDIEELYKYDKPSEYILDEINRLAQLAQESI